MPEKALTRAERNNIARRELILDVAREMIKIGGFVNLNMTHIAQAVDCSVGAVYGCFSCKEEVLVHLAMRGAVVFRDMLERARAFEGNSREKMVAVHLSHNSFSKSNSIEYEAFYTCKSDGVRERISEESHKELDAIISDCLNIAQSIVVLAEKNHDIRLSESVTATELVYNLWALQFGNLILGRCTYTTDGEFREKVVVQRLFFRRFLDGFGWKPLSDKFDYVESGKKIVQQLGLFV